jgi:predicted RNase H-like nuclease (RuvC/YqgF family)
MTNPIVHAFFLGRAIAETLNEQLEQTLTNTLSEIGKFDAEQRERLRQFTDQVNNRAQQAESISMQGRAVANANHADVDDLQATIDELRAEVARLRSELKNYRSRVS